MKPALCSPSAAVTPPDPSTLEPLPIAELHPPADIGAGWTFAQGTPNGAPHNDGISGFLELVAKLSTLPPKEAKKLLFADGLTTLRTKILGKDRIFELANRNLADPSLLFALQKQAKQSILNYLHAAYGIRWIEALRRTICNPAGEQHCSLTLRLSVDGIWEWRPHLLSGFRTSELLALTLDS